MVDLRFNCPLDETSCRFYNQPYGKCALLEIGVMRGNDSEGICSKFEERVIECSLCGTKLKGDVDTWPTAPGGYICPRCYEVWNRSCCGSPIKQSCIWTTLKDLVARARVADEEEKR